MAQDLGLGLLEMLEIEYEVLLYFCQVDLPAQHARNHQITPRIDHMVIAFNGELRQLRQTQRLILRRLLDGEVLDTLEHGVGDGVVAVADGDQVQHDREGAVGGQEGRQAEGEGGLQVDRERGADALEGQ